MSALHRVILRQPWIVLIIIAVLTVFFAFHARHIRIDSSLESLLPEGDPEKHYYEDVRRMFGSDDVAVIALITDNIYTPQTLQKIQRLTDEFRKIPEVKSVLSLTNAKDIVADVLGEQPALLIPQIPGCD
ncbi:MAG: hypothetical protein FJ147_28265 [Deltaproteobacteria bacterium]|nr:hypothetical protein [Deltaproteobacteria bacterium]